MNTGQHAHRIEARTMPSTQTLLPSLQRAGQAHVSSAAWRLQHHYMAHGKLAAELRHPARICVAVQVLKSVYGVPRP